MQFADVPGNLPVKDVLAHQVNTQRISHAQLFFGGEGCGTLPIAIAFVQYLFCEDKSAKDSCGNCPSCLKVSKLVHPDFHLLFPVNTNKNITKDARCSDYIVDFREAVLSNPYLSLYDWLQYISIENKQGNIATEEASEIIRKLSYTSYESDYKVVLIWMAASMNTTASNKLLKSFEEPTEKTLFILITEKKEDLLITIQSRVQAIKFKFPEEKETVDFLISATDLDNKKANQIARLCDGNLNLALKLASEGDALNQDTQSFIEWMRICYKINMTKLMPWVESTAGSGRENQKNFLRHSIKLIRQTYMLNLSLTALVKLSDNDFESLRKLSPFINNGNIADLLQIFNSAHTALERNAAAKILFLNLSFKVSSLLNQKTVAQKAA